MKAGKIKSFLAILTALFVVSGQKTVRATDAFCTAQGHGGNTSSPWINTALGCVPVKVDEFVMWLLPNLFGIAGGISLVLMIYGFILMATSSGDPKAVQGAKETISSALVGLLISIFSIFILKYVLVNILKIPGIN